MHYLFADPSGFFTGTRDIWQCRQEAIDDGVAYNELNCDVIGVAGTRQGELTLQEEEGESRQKCVTFHCLTSEPSQGTIS